MSRRPLPTPLSGPRGSPLMAYGGPEHCRPRWIPLLEPLFCTLRLSSNPADGPYEIVPTTLPGGTLIHKRFYDLLSMIPTPSPSRLIWGAPAAEEAGILASPRKDRRISKDMVPRPTGFVRFVNFGHQKTTRRYKAL
ncbi:hypothetical protein C8J57DRAFT_638944 [Mycena rebaudengoi]|nr:hypothetical protein C8J57DRAFT_638944 [Mycena rebaudengoi]